ncbi:MAG: hypothetical protein AAFR58_20690 [Cyanobacteria bacterium J06627_28]
MFSKDMRSPRQFPIAQTLLLCTVWMIASQGLWAQMAKAEPLVTMTTGFERELMALELAELELAELELLAQAVSEELSEEIPTEIPEEILRTEIITEARSPVDGERLTAAEYAQLEAELAVGRPPMLSQRIRYIIFLLEFRRAVKPILPFL